MIGAGGDTGGPPVPPPLRPATSGTSSSPSCTCTGRWTWTSWPGSWASWCSVTTCSAPVSLTSTGCRCCRRCPRCRSMWHHSDIESPPLVRWTVLRYGPLEHVLLHVEHHMVHDGWSFDVFYAELAELYEARRPGGRRRSLSWGVGFGDLAAWQHDWLHGPVLARFVNHWIARLVGAPSLDLPTDRPRSAEFGFRRPPRVSRCRPASTAHQARGRHRGKADRCRPLRGNSLLRCKACSSPARRRSGRTVRSWWPGA